MKSKKILFFVLMTILTATAVNADEPLKAFRTLSIALEKHLNEASKTYKKELPKTIETYFKEVLESFKEFAKVIESSNPQGKRVLTSKSFKDYVKVKKENYEKLVTDLEKNLGKDHKSAMKDYFTANKNNHMELKFGDEETPKDIDVDGEAKALAVYKIGDVETTEKALELIEKEKFEEAMKTYFTKSLKTAKKVLKEIPKDK